MEKVKTRLTWHDETCPIPSFFCDAETELDDDGRKIYLHVQWSQIDPEAVLMHPLTASVYDLYDRCYAAKGKDQKTVNEDIGRILVENWIDDADRYSGYLDELVRMVLASVAERGFLEKVEDEGCA